MEGRIRDIGRSSPPPSRVQARYVGLLRLTDAGASTVRARHARLQARFGEGPWREGRTLRQGYMTDFLQDLVEAGVAVHAVPVKRGWLEIDSVSDYELALDWYRQGTIGRFCNLDRA